MAGVAAAGQGARVVRSPDCSHDCRPRGDGDAKHHLDEAAIRCETDRPLREVDSGAHGARRGGGGWCRGGWWRGAHGSEREQRVGADSEHGCSSGRRGVSGGDVQQHALLSSAATDIRTDSQCSNFTGMGVFAQGNGLVLPRTFLRNAQAALKRSKAFREPYATPQRAQRARSLHVVSKCASRTTGKKCVPRLDQQERLLAILQVVQRRCSR